MAITGHFLNKTEHNSEDRIRAQRTEPRAVRNDGLGNHYQGAEWGPTQGTSSRLPWGTRDNKEMERGTQHSEQLQQLQLRVHMYEWGHLASPRASLQLTENAWMSPKGHFVKQKNCPPESAKLPMHMIVSK